uniref:DUF834 domain-containing protein n=1 Tax=Oryza nivara TaxID=4536 RepID=A0A0E0GY46_ORYNI
MEWGNGVENELARKAVKPAVEAAQHSSGGSGGGAWLEATRGCCGSEAERWTGCGNAWRGRRRKRRGAGTAAVAS